MLCLNINKTQRTLWLLILIIANQVLVAQSVSSSCDQAIEIPVPDNGYGMGMFVSEVIDLTNAEKEFGEYFPDGFDYLALDHKTVWFKFSIATARSVNLELRQIDSAISQNAVGMVIYKEQSCLPGATRLEPRLIPINKFGEVGSNCLELGEYLIQVCASHKANDSIWLQLTLGEPPLYYDFKATAHDFGKFNGHRSFVIQPTCLSLESSDEKNSLLPDNFEKTAWFTFESSENNASFNLRITPVNTQIPADTVYAVLYKGDARNTSLTMTRDTLSFWHRAGVFNNQNKLYYKMDCFLENNQRYSIQVFFKTSVTDNYRLDLSQLTAHDEQSAQPLGLSNAFHMGNLHINQNVVSTGMFSCGSFMKDNICEPANSAILPIINNFEYDLVAWRTFTLVSESEVTFTPRITMCGSGSSIRQIAFRIFEGNIRQNCNLPVLDTVISGSHSICLKPGVYSLQILGISDIPLNNTSQFNVNLCNTTYLGEQFSITLLASSGQTPILSMFGNPNNPENLGNITSQLNSSQVVVPELDYINKRHAADTFRIRDCKDRVYREFYLAEPTALQVRRVHVGGVNIENSNTFFIKGRISFGMDSMQIISNRIGIISGNHSFGTGCSLLDSGWYSLIGCGSINENCLENQYKHVVNNLEIRKGNESCKKPPNSLPSGSLSLNPTNNDLLTIANTPNNGTDLDFAKRYVAVNQCTSCDSNHAEFINKVYYSCVQSPDTLRFTSAFFFHFKTDMVSDFELDDLRRYLLFKGDYRSDSIGLLDINNRVISCTDKEFNYNKRYYCGIEPGFYTLVIFNQGFGDANNVTFWYDNHLKPKYDHVKSAYQFGELQPSVEHTSPTDVISCLTGAHREHPGIQQFQENYLLSYPIEQNKNQLTSNVIRNLWYTFTIRGSGEVQITLENRSRAGGSVSIAVYESSVDANIPFDVAYNQGLIDSNFNQGLKQVLLQNGKFNIGSACLIDTSVVRRYFIVATLGYSSSSQPILKKFIRLKVLKTNSLDDKSPGDYCHDANQFDISGMGNYTSPDYNIKCHTMGEGFGEDGSNLACLNLGVPFKTTWVKISISNIIKGDISFSITPGLIPSNQNQFLRYRVLYGDCKALTPGPCVAYWGSSFRLDCMPPGDYFIQIATPVDAEGSFKVNVNVTPSLYPDCKPAPLFEPFANFNFTPPCNDSIVHFQNWSTAGEDITYYWDFGNGTTSTEKSPEITFNNSNDIDTFLIKLVVTNSAHQSKDSIIKLLRTYKEPFNLKIHLENDSLCSGFVDLSLESNFSHTTDLSWTPNPYQSDDSLNRYRFYTPPNQHFVKIKAQSKRYECILTDSIILRKQELYSFYLDTFACNGDSILIDLTEKANSYGINSITWQDGSVSFMKSITDTGVFRLILRKEECIWLDTIKISTSSISDNTTPEYNFACNGSIVKLGINPNLSNPMWSTGEQTHKISVDTSGLYHVSANFHHCLLQDSFEVEIPIIPDLLGFSDTIKCIEESITFNLNNPNYEYEWFDGTESADYTVWDTGEYWVRITDRACDTVFRFSVGEYPSTLELEADTTLCDLVPIRLDAGMGQSFIWRPTNEIEQAIQVNDFGIYSVTKVNQFGCVEFDTFTLTRYCGPKLFVPNAFSPNGDGLNETFLPVNENLTSFRMIILNRWGEQIFETKSTEIGWDGTFGGVKCQDGVYTYIIWYSMEDEGKLIDGVTKGTVTLMR